MYKLGFLDLNLPRDCDVGIERGPGGAVFFDGKPDSASNFVRIKPLTHGSKPQRDCFEGRDIAISASAFDADVKVFERFVLLPKNAQYIHGAAACDRR